MFRANRIISPILYSCWLRDEANLERYGTKIIKARYLVTNQYSPFYIGKTENNSPPNPQSTAPNSFMIPAMVKE